jgi:hypothetical protein
MDRKSIRAVIDGVYAARSANDFLRLRAHFGEAPRYLVAGSPEARPPTAREPVADTAGFEAALNAMVQTWTWLSYSLEAVLIDDDRAAVHWSATLRLTGKDEPVDTQGVDLFTFENGKVSGLTAFIDTAKAAQLLA